VFIVLVSYLACGIGAFGGIELLSRYHEYEWEKKINDARYARKCNHWLCDSLNDVWGEDISSYFTNALADFTTSFQFADLKLSMWHFQLIYRIGASGVVYGWMGMRLVTSWMSPHHSRLNGLDYFFIISTLVHDLNETPISLEDLGMSTLMGGDGIDHAAHIMGAVFGMIWAVVLILWTKITSFGLFGGRWRGTGRRLGASWEDEQLRREQQQQRMQNIHLLNQSRTSRGPRPRDRTML